MQPEARVVVVEDDAFARDLMAMLLARDWRTRIVAEFESAELARMRQFIAQPANLVDVWVVDADAAGEQGWLWQLWQVVRQAPHAPSLLVTCTQPRRSTLEAVVSAGGSGYMIKNEILYGLAAAVAAAASGRFVATPGVRDLASGLPALAGRTVLPENTVVLDGRRPVANFTHREIDMARLGILFNLAQRDISDELVVSTDFVAETMSQIYEKLGLHSMIAGETPVEDYFEDERLAARMKLILEQAKPATGGRAGHKAPWMATAAFHLLTEPERV